MLLLSRKPHETIFIGSIRITIVAIRGRRTLIGIDAPQNVPILRGELQKKERPGRDDQTSPEPLRCPTPETA